jgi:5-(carboxyamino)imidazole ribonucleotide synthase
MASEPQFKHSVNTSRPKKIGIIGGGQLGLMIGESLAKYPVQVSVYDPDPEAPARRIVTDHSSSGGHMGFVCAPFDDQIQLSRFLAAQDAVTYEWESIDCLALRTAAAESGTRILPSPAVLEMTRSRFAERHFIENAGLPCVPFGQARSIDDVTQATIKLGYPLVIKTDRGGYDGKGQWVLTSQANFETATKDLEQHFATGGAVLVEQRIDLVSEASCIVARGSHDGNLHSVTFPVFENVHHDQVLSHTRLPCTLAPQIANQARAMALACAEALQLEGVLTVEFFFGKLPGRSDSQLFINEFAPRPHNSGHISRRATTQSQFDVLAQCLMGLPLAEPKLLPPPVGRCYQMANIMGQDFLDAGDRVKFAAQITRAKGSDLLEYFDYGKSLVAPRRKMGHYITLEPDPTEI